MRVEPLDEGRVDQGLGEVFGWGLMILHVQFFEVGHVDFPSLILNDGVNQFECLNGLGLQLEVSRVHVADIEIATVGNLERYGHCY